MHIKAKYIAPNQDPLYSLQQARNALKQSQKIIARKNARYLVRLRTVKAKTKSKIIRETQAAIQKDYQKKLLELELNYQRLIATANKDCLQLALSIAQQVLECELKSNHDSLLSRIKQVLANMLDQRTLKIYVNPSDQVALKQYLKLNYPEMNWQVFPLSEISSGNARLETTSGTLELSWQEDFELIAMKLRQKLGNVLNAGS